jgi:hypothetical protein
MLSDADIAEEERVKWSCDSASFSEHLIAAINETRGKLQAVRTATYT